jgi:hypothetical protein
LEQIDLLTCHLNEQGLFEWLGVGNVRSLFVTSEVLGQKVFELTAFIHRMLIEHHQHIASIASRRASLTSALQRELD